MHIEEVRCGKREGVVTMCGFDGSVEMLLINRGKDERVEARKSG